MNTQAIIALKTHYQAQWNSNPKMLEELNENKPLAISYSLVEGLCSLYPTVEAAQAAYDEAVEEGQIQDVTLDMTKLVVSGKFPIPEEDQYLSSEIYQAACEVISEIGNVEFLPNWVDLHSRAGDMWMAS